MLENPRSRPRTALLIAALVASEDADIQPLRDEIAALMQQHVGVTTPGAMIAVVGPGGPLILESRGLADPGAQTPLTVDSRTPVASVSKVVTALTALTLHEDGLLDLDADIRDYFPVRDERQAQTPVTGRHLLTHTAGLAEPLLLHPAPPTEENTDPILPALQEHPPVLRYPTDVGLHYSALQ